MGKVLANLNMWPLVYKATALIIFEHRQPLKYVYKIIKYQCVFYDTCVYSYYKYNVNLYVYA